MLDLAKANDIDVILGSITPITALPWAIKVGNPGAWVLALNRWLEVAAADRGLTYVDYFSRLADPDGGFRADLTRDGVHPRRSGYVRMPSLIDPTLRSE